jgi:queuine tRNA-ribosyltransferase
VTAEKILEGATRFNVSGDSDAVRGTKRQLSSGEMCQELRCELPRFPGALQLMPSTQRATKASWCRLEIQATDGRARTGRLWLGERSVEVPVFMPVATRGTVRAVPMELLERLGFELVLSNTYHLTLRPGADVIAQAGGFRSWSSWKGAVLTDSGGYQGYSLRSMGFGFSEGGISLRSVYDGSKVLLTPEGVLAAEELIGSDVAMALDICPPSGVDAGESREAVELTLAWAQRTLRARAKPDQAVFGILQGGTDTALRSQSAKATASLLEQSALGEVSFDGFALGGLALGETRSAREEAIDAAVSELPAQAPRYLMGVGDPLSVIDAIAAGVDMFDCVSPTRLARHGGVLSDQGKWSLRNAAVAKDDGPLESGCKCFTCERYGRGYLRHLLMVKDPAAMTLLSVHNLFFMQRFMETVREAIVLGRLGQLREQVAQVW